MKIKSIKTFVDDTEWIFHENYRYAYGHHPHGFEHEEITQVMEFFK